MLRISLPARFLLIAIAALLCVPMLLLPFRNETALQAFHNRTLAVWPAPNVFVGDPPAYFKQARNWIADRAGFITEAAVLQNRILFYVLGTPPAPRITIGLKNHVFVNGVSNNAVDGVFRGTCVGGHSRETAEVIERFAQALKAFAGRRNWTSYIVIAPMTPTVYSDTLPKSVPRALREACTEVANGTSHLIQLTQRADLNIVYPYREMRAGRDIVGFFPIAHFHPVGLSVKVIRDAFLSRAGLRPTIQETIKLSRAPSEILSPYGVNETYPIHDVYDANITNDAQANTALVKSLSNMFIGTEGPRYTKILVNPRGDAVGKALLISDSLGHAAASSFAAGFKRLTWIYIFGMLEQTRVAELIERAARLEEFDTIIMLVNEGGVGLFDAWMRSVGAEQP